MEHCGAAALHLQACIVVKLPYRNEVAVGDSDKMRWSRMCFV